MLFYAWRRLVIMKECLQKNIKNSLSELQILTFSRGISAHAYFASSVTKVWLRPWRPQYAFVRQPSTLHKISIYMVEELLHHLTISFYQLPCTRYSGCLGHPDRVLPHDWHFSPRNPAMSLVTDKIEGWLKRRKTLHSKLKMKTVRTAILACTRACKPTV